VPDAVRGSGRPESRILGDGRLLQGGKTRAGRCASRFSGGSLPHMSHRRGLEDRRDATRDTLGLFRPVQLAARDDVGVTASSVAPSPARCRRRKRRNRNKHARGDGRGRRGRSPFGAEPARSRAGTVRMREARRREKGDTSPLKGNIIYSVQPGGP